MSIVDNSLEKLNIPWGKWGHLVAGSWVFHKTQVILLWELMACGDFVNLSSDEQGTPCRSPSCISLLDVDILQRQLQHLTFVSHMISSMAHWEGGKGNLKHAFISSFII